MLASMFISSLVIELPMDKRIKKNEIYKPHDSLKS